ncbi:MULTISPECIES: Fic family protein [unclassified Variovorax]|uniref:Fic family protein n=1 Tax=unclassified Variovorax TaxID=663243 RepID=UPI002B22E01E|nr:MULTISPECIES: Fic family protein [unclassified Variovorax]MEB0056412.1 Fic family protein [Variovorax sp. LG9.2]MEB0110539.1 Fic family protein [Variovorax sp. RTB1]
MHSLPPLEQLDAGRFDTPAILKKLASASRQLAELKGIAAAIPNQDILINTLGLQEAKASSEIENIITTHDELFKDDVLPEAFANPAAKEVLRYRQALRIGFDLVRSSGLITSNQIVEIQSELERNNAGFRKLPGTALRDGAGRTVYTPPQDPAEIVALMRGLERFINEPDLFAVDPLIKMALIHHQFESIHPFYDGNGRTGRIVNVLYLVKEGLLDSPVLYLSSYIMRNKADYYRLLQTVRTENRWEEWVLYLLEAVQQTAAQTIGTINAIKAALADYKQRIRAGYKFYSQDLINNLFMHPYTKIDFIQRDLQLSRLTATKYLDALAEGGFVQKQKIGRSNYYVNLALTAILQGDVA